MAHEPDSIYKALRLVPDFDGNPNILTRFIRLCDQIVHKYMSNTPGSELSNLCLLNGILNKITGTASCTINSNGIPDSWVGIRTALINNFSDQRDETTLYNDLSLATQGNRSPQDFYDHCQTLLSTIMTYVSLHENISTTIEAKRSLYKKVAMQAFVRGLKEPLGSRVRCMRPDTIEKALEYVQEEMNVIYLQQRDSSRVTQNFKVTMPSPNLGYLPPRPSYQPQTSNWPSPLGQRPPHQPPQPFKFNNMQPQAHNRMPSRTQQMFRALPPNYNPRSNVFRLPPRHNLPYGTPKPMSGVQAFTPKVLPPLNHDRFNKSHEMHVNECAPYTVDSYYSSYYTEPEYNHGTGYADCEDYVTGYAEHEHSIEYDSADQYSELTDRHQLTDGYECQAEPSTSTGPNFRLDRKSQKPR